MCECNFPASHIIATLTVLGLKCVTEKHSKSIVNLFLPILCILLKNDILYASRALLHSCIKLNGLQRMITSTYPLHCIIEDLKSWITSGHVCQCQIQQRLKIWQVIQTSSDYRYIHSNTQKCTHFIRSSWILWITLLCTLKHMVQRNLNHWNSFKYHTCQKLI